MQFTENKTTVKIGQCRATCLAKTRHFETQPTIITWELMYPRYIHAELMTYRVFSRNAASSRATPIRVTLNEVRENPAFFSHVGAERPGMVAGCDLDGTELEQFRADWMELGGIVADKVEAMSKRYGIHNQVLNRALEPWLFIRTIVTTTDTENFYRQRIAPDAQPEMRDLATCMNISAKRAVESNSRLHMPYFSESEALKLGLSLEQLIVRNIAAAARVCIMRHDGKTPTLEQDYALVRRLAREGHMTPFEHVAYAFGGRRRCANLKGWKSVRNAMETCANDWVSETILNVVRGKKDD